MYTIYLIQNRVNQKCYVGFTGNPVKNRWKQHIYAASSGGGFKLHSAIRKFGLENFEFSVIYQSKDREDTLLNKETFFIREYNSYKNGYNCNEGGINFNSEEMRKNSSIRMKINNPMKKGMSNRGSFKKGEFHPAFVYTEERRKKASISKKGELNPFFGVKGNFEKANMRTCCIFCKKETNKGNFVRWHQGCK